MKTILGRNFSGTAKHSHFEGALHLGHVEPYIPATGKCHGMQDVLM